MKNKNPSDSSDSSSKTQNAACSDDNGVEKSKEPAEHLSLLDSIINELLAIVDKKA